MQYLNTAQGRSLAYCYSPGEGACIVFLSGLRSDMQGTKAVHLEAWARARGRAFLRFDYSGHGASSGRFEDGCIGDWAQDTAAIINDLTDGQVILIGSSMGGWQALLYARAWPERVGGLVTIAAAPDFTEDGYWASFSSQQKAELTKNGQIEIPSEYTRPYVITRRLIEDGRDHLVLRAPLDLPFKVRCLQGTDDSAVSTDVAVRLLNHAYSPDMQLCMVKDADHRFSSPGCLALIETAITQVS